MAFYHWVDIALKNSKVIIPLLLSLLSYSGISTWFGLDQSQKLDEAKELQNDMVGHIEYVNKHYVMPKHIKHEVITKGSCDAECVAKVKKEVNEHVRKFHE